MPAAMQVSTSQLWKILSVLFLLSVFVIVVLVVFDKATKTSDISRPQPYVWAIDALKQAEERSIVVFKDGEMGYVTRAERYGHPEVKERCSTRLVPAPTRMPSFLERIEKVVRVDDPNYQELRIEYIARCFLTHGR